MRRTISLFVFLSLLICITGCSNKGLEDSGGLEEGIVTKNVDGDTIYAKINGHEEKIRMVLVNTPESTTRKEAYGGEASDYTKKNLYIGRKIYLEKDVSDRDKYNRLLRYIWLEKPKEISNEEIKEKMYNARLLIEGYAQVATFPPDVKYVDYFIEYEKLARNSSKGLWKLDVYNKPKKGLANNNATVYYTDNGKSYHRIKGCKSLKNSKIIKDGKLGQVMNLGKKVPCNICVK